MMDGLIWKGILFSALLLVAAIWDVRRSEIPDWIPLLIFLTGIPQIKLPDAFFGLVVTGLPYLFVAVLSCKREDLSIGGGDIKLMAACGFVLGVWGGILQSIAALTLSLIVGFGICIYRRTKKLNTVTMPLAPFFCIGGIFSYCALLFSASI
jgi:leader peptidase (prepilin peptidase) / N-methyltransferase